MLDLEVLGKWSAVLEVAKPDPRVLNKLREHIGGNRFFEHPDGDRMVRVAAEHFSRDAIGPIEQLKPSPSRMTSDATCIIQGAFIESCRLTPGITRTPMQSA